MNRRSFLKNSIGSLLFGVLSTNKVLAAVIDTIPLNSMDVLLYAVQTKWGDWKIRATKWTNLNSEKLKNSEFNIDTFTMLGVFDNSQIKKEQSKFAKQYSAIRSLHSVDHYQCTINGKNYPISKQATYKSRSSGGKTRVMQNKKSGYWVEMTEKYSSENGKKNIKHCQTKYAKIAQQNSASYIIEQVKNNSVVKTWKGTKSFKGSQFNYATIKKHIQNKTEYKEYFWRYKKTTNKKHRKSIWTDIKIKKVAKQCSYKAEFRKNYQQAFYMAKQLGIFEEVTSHMKRPFPINKGKSMSTEQKLKISNTLKNKKYANIYN
jgi:hypothetical protein